MILKHDVIEYLILEGSEVASPRVCMPVVIPLLPKVPGHVAIDDRLTQNNALVYAGMI
jgi:hypothetical protein